MLMGNSIKIGDSSYWLDCSKNPHRYSVNGQESLIFLLKSKIKKCDPSKITQKDKFTKILKYSYTVIRNFLE
jgi:hypothetical protein